jgi:hypothetical protein
MADHITRYDKMPIPPIAEHTEYFEAGAIRIGVEYRVLTDAVASAIRASLQGAQGTETGRLENLDDCGVSLHVFGDDGAQILERLRFDCFQEEPHYHYVNWPAKSNELLHIDPVADGDPLAWALERIRTRLPQMLARAGCADIAARVDLNALEAIAPQLTEAAYRARFRVDKEQIRVASEQRRL